MGGRRAILSVTLLSFLAAALLIGLSQLSVRRERQGTFSPTFSPSPAPQASPQPQPAKGDPSAPVKIVEFADFYCSFCARYLWEIFPRLEQEYIRKGLVRYEFRIFTSHKAKSLLAGIAAECAQEQGKFWPFHERLFESIFGRDVSQPRELDVAAIKKIALEAGLDMERFSACIYDEVYSKCLSRYNSCIAEGGDKVECFQGFNLCMTENPMMERVLEDRKELRRLREQLPREEREKLGKLGTPLFFINDQVIIGLHPYEKFKEVIEQELTKAKGGWGR